MRNLFEMSLAARALHRDELLERYTRMRSEPLHNPWEEVELYAFDALAVALEIHDTAFFVIEKLEDVAPKAPSALVLEARKLTLAVERCQVAITSTCRSALWVARNYRRMSPSDLEAASGFNQGRVDHFLSPDSAEDRDPRPEYLFELPLVLAHPGEAVTEYLASNTMEALLHAYAVTVADDGRVRDDHDLYELFVSLQFCTQARLDLEASLAACLREMAYSWDDIAPMFGLRSAQGVQQRYGDRLREPDETTFG